MLNKPTNTNTPSPSKLSRRKALGLLGSVPVVFTGTSLFSLTACGGSAEAAAVPTSVVFNNMANPATVADRATTFTNATIKVAYSDNSTKTLRLAYNTLYKTGDVLKTPAGDDVIAGGYFNANGDAIMDMTGSTPQQFFSDGPDGQSLIKLPKPAVSGIKGNTLFLVTQFEYKSKNQNGDSMYGKLPSAVGIATLDQDKTTGELTVKSYYNVPTADVHGLWITCAGSMSPWDTHLSSEEYEPDAWAVEHGGSPQLEAFSLNTFGDATRAKPYHYGHVPEVTVNPDGTGAIKKHYCMGRISREKVKVMPDKRTVLQGDDATSGGLFMFVADVAGELSAGTLYAAALTATSVPTGSAVKGGAFDITWIKLGHSSSAEIEAMANLYAASDIMDVLPNDTSADTTAYTLVNYGSTNQYVKIKAGMEKAAAFLETRRYAALMGATMELTKFEGVTLDIANKIAYLAVSAIKSTMSDATGDIQLAKTSAGATYAAVLGTDTTIGSDWVANSMSVPEALMGEDMSADADKNTAVVSKIANTDNVSFSNAMGTLFIGEDSGMHLNNTVWAYNVASKSLSRILTVPAGAECTGLQVNDNVNGFAYVLSNFQHPGDFGFLSPSQDELKAAVQANWGELKDAKAAVGYISGIPCLS